ncbi:MAG: type II toxin-antitoxin system Phd/YefM family antitoxin [Desulfococcaceae bacterium]
MLVVSASELKNNLFKYIDEITKGEKIIIRHDHKNVARLTRVSASDWRDRMKIHPKLLVPPEKIIEPAVDIWEEYV